MANKKIVIEFLGESKDLQNTIDGLDGKTSKMSGVFGKVGKAAAVGFGAVAAGAVIGGKYVLDHGAKLEQMAAKADTVFGSQIGAVEKWADKSAHAMGLTRMEATGLAANFGDLLVPMGFSRKEAAKMSTDVVGLSGALSQWSGGTVSAAEASDVLAKAMLGERDGLKALGISISEEDVKAELLRNGQDKLTGAALQQAKATATQTLIMQKSTDAQAAFAAGGSPLLSAQAKLSAVFGEVRDKVVMGLVPAITMAADWMLTKGLPAAQAFGGWLQDHMPPIFEKIQAVVSTVMGAMNGDVGGGLAGIQGIFTNVTSIITTLWDTFGATLVDFIVKTVANLQQIIGGAFTIIQGIFQTFSALLQGDWSGVWEGIKTILDGAWEIIKGVVKQALNILGTIFELGWTALKNIVELAWDGIKTLIVAGITKWVELLTAIPGKFTNALSSLASTVGGLFMDAMTAGKEKVENIGGTIVDWIADIPGKLLNKLGDFKSAGSSLIGGFVEGMRGAAGLVSDIAGNVWNAVRTLLNDGIGKINSALEFTISVAGKDFTINPPDIPALAKGGIVNRPTLALIGEDGPEAVVPLSQKHNPGGVMPGMGGGGSIVVQLMLPGGKVIEQLLIQHSRDTGRPLQVATLGPA